MKCFVKSGVFFLAVVFSFTVSSSICLAAALEEKGLQIKPLLSGGKIASVKVMIKEANGGPKVNTLQLDYPGSTILTTIAALTVKKGFYKIELLENDKPSLTLKAQNGKKVTGNGRISVNAGGVVQYRVTAKKAKAVTFNLSFTLLPILPAQEESRVSQVASEEKLSSDDGGLNLRLTCIAGKNCLVQVQNMSRSKTYRNILFQIDYKMMTRNDVIEKSKYGTVEDALFPSKTGEWPLDLVFGEPPKDIKISLIRADAVDTAEAKALVTGQQKNIVIPLTSSEKQKKSDVTAAPASLSGQAGPGSSPVK